MSRNQASLFPENDFRRSEELQRGAHLSLVIPPLPQTFTYHLPERLLKKVAVGDRITVPFGRRTASAFVVATAEITAPLSSQEFTIRSIESCSDAVRCFAPHQLPLFEWVANYYGEPLSNVIETAIPHAVKQKYKTLLELSPSAPSSSPRGATQRKVVAFLSAAKKPVSQSEILQSFPGATVTIRKLLSDGYLCMRKEITEDDFSGDETPPVWAKTTVTLNESQADAVAIAVRCSDEQNPTPLLLHGVTGSGKTEVYIEAIKQVTARGKSALILVPEIALTPQLVDRFRARLGNEIAVLHSGLSRRTRWNSWNALLQDRCRIAIGARSGVFAPLRQIGLIIVDEEHDPSYKQNEGLRYNARDLAIVRAGLERCPVLLGSATPSLESYYHAVKKKYHYLTLPSRPHSTHSLKIEIIDMNRVKPWEMPSKNLSPYLFERITQTLADHHQAFILYNRRGFASYLQCEQCETVMECPNCSVTLTYHQKQNSLLCHYCNLGQVPPRHCPHCSKRSASKGTDIAAVGTLTHRGAGTERVFEELSSLFPGVVLDRLDRDAVCDIEQYRRILERVRSGETQILIGTQMIAKGHDIEGVRLVGIVDCDVGLHMPDFRAAERAYQLLTQMSGRAGRGKIPGEVVLQTRVPRHPSLIATQHQSFVEFAKTELHARRSLEHPPFTRLMRIVALSPQKEEGGYTLHTMKEKMLQYIEREKIQMTLLGPARAPLERIKAQWRWHLLCKSRSSRDLLKLRMFLQSLPRSHKVRVIFDLDPQDML